MTDKDITNVDFALTTDPDKMVAAETKVGEVEGQQVSDSDFSLVQQNTKIHDQKFTTKPTTFFKDAIHRFSKDHSAIIGGVILGLLFVLAILLPIPGVIPYQVGVNYSSTVEANLPPKIHSAGNGNWDGTRWYKNQSWPYETEEQNPDYFYSDTTADSSAVIRVANVQNTYTTGKPSDGIGGFAAITKTSNNANFLSEAYDFDFQNDYKMTYVLGFKEGQTYSADAKYSVILRYGASKTTVELESTPIATDGTGLPEKAIAPTEGGTIATLKAVTVDYTKLVLDYAAKNAKLQAALDKGENVLSQSSVGLLISGTSGVEEKLYVKSLNLTTNSPENSDDWLEMKALSFDSACEMLNRKKDEDGNWSSSTNGFQAEDVKIRRCDILYDMYTISYGKVRNTAIPEATIQSWIDDGYINYDVNKPTLNKDIRTEKGKESNEVYVYSIQSQTKDSMKDDEGKDITYNKFTCTVIEYKMLGYSSFPVHLFGTDDKGRDVLKYSFSGLRTSLLLGVIVALINITFGLIWGSISGYFGGWTDLAMERIVEVLSGIPWIILMTVISIKLGSSAFSFGLALCLTGWIGTESVTREQFYRYKDREYVLAAKTLGAKSPRLIFRHILPNAIGTIITSSVLIIPSTIFSEATIAFLGLGLKNVASLGVILSTYEGSVSSYPYQMAVPAVIISLLMICFNLFGNGLRDAFNPSLKGAE